MKKGIVCLVVCFVCVLCQLTCFAYNPIYDLNGDGVVDIQDVYILEPTLNSMLGDPRYVPEYDFNGDGVINFQEVMILGYNFS